MVKDVRLYKTGDQLVAGFLSQFLKCVLFNKCGF